MSEELRRQANAYRLRAEEVRAVADSAADERSCEALLRMAESYETMARNIERIIGDTPTVPRDKIAIH